MRDSDDLNEDPMVIDAVDDPPLGTTGRVVAHPVGIVGQDSADELDARGGDLLRRLTQVPPGTRRVGDGVAAGHDRFRNSASTSCAGMPCLQLGLVFRDRRHQIRIGSHRDGLL